MRYDPFLTAERSGNIITSVIVKGRIMSKKPTTTRQDMIDAAFQLIREEGFESLTARNLAGRLGCSTQPIMYQFPNLNELKDLTYRKADDFHTEFIFKDNDLLKIGLRYISFADEEKDLFRFLFQSGHFDGSSLGELLKAPDTKRLISKTAEELNIPDKKALKCFETLFVMVHGYASLIANNAMKYNEK